MEEYIRRLKKCLDRIHFWKRFEEMEHMGTDFLENLSPDDYNADVKRGKILAYKKVLDLLEKRNLEEENIAESITKEELEID